MVPARPVRDHRSGQALGGVRSTAQRRFHFQLLTLYTLGHYLSIGYQHIFRVARETHVRRSAYSSAWADTGNKRPSPPMVRVVVHLARLIEPVNGWETSFLNRGRRALAVDSPP